MHHCQGDSGWMRTSEDRRPSQDPSHGNSCHPPDVSETRADCLVTDLLSHISQNTSKPSYVTLTVEKIDSKLSSLKLQILSIL